MKCLIAQMTDRTDQNRFAPTVSSVLKDLQSTALHCGTRMMAASLRWNSCYYPDAADKLIRKVKWLSSLGVRALPRSGQCRASSSVIDAMIARDRPVACSRA